MRTSTAKNLVPGYAPDHAPDYAIANLPAAEPSPFVKWVGGKSRVMAQLTPLLPAGAELMRHVEPFVGGGAMFFSRRPARAMLCDANPTLIETYTAVRDEVHDVIRNLDVLARTHSDAQYYSVRERYNQRAMRSNAERAATFIYLNKTCFNGLHRVNRRGEFNVPMGRYTNPKILDISVLLSASQELRRADLRCVGFEALIESARPGDFVYFDPPYAPVSRTASFTAYSQAGFSDLDQTRLRDVFRVLDQRRCKLMLSNSDVPAIRELYAEYRIDVVMASRAVNSDASKRGKVQEVVVRNY